MSAPVRVFPDLQTLSDAVADSVADRIRRVVGEGGQFCVALAGGQTPKVLYETIAARFGPSLPWSRVHLFWGDERYVGSDDSRSNFGMARKVLLDRIDIPPSNVHPMPTSSPDPQESASTYEETLRHFFGRGQPKFDLILLGMGADGHTASLFPGSPALQEKTRWVLPVRASVDPPVRLTMTMPVILQAAAVYFLIAGRDKAEILGNIMRDEEAVLPYPAAEVLYSTGPEVICWADEAASAYIRP